MFVVRRVSSADNEVNVPDAFQENSPTALSWHVFLVRVLGCFSFKMVLVVSQIWSEDGDWCQATFGMGHATFLI